MHTLNSRPRLRDSKSACPTDPLPSMGSEASHRRPPTFQSRHHGANCGSGSAGEGYQKLKDRLVSRSIPESVVEELIEQSSIISYGRGSFIVFKGAPIDLLFWVSSGLVDILSPGVDGEQIRSSVLGPGEFFGFVESTDHKGRPAQAFQARARTNVQVGLLVREHLRKVLSRQDPSVLIHILEEIVAAWGELTLRNTQFLGNHYSSRLEVVLADLAAKFGVKEYRGTLLIPEFGHSDFAEMIGCSRPMVSRLIGDMIAAGSLAQEGKHYIIIDDSAFKNARRATA